MILLELLKNVVGWVEILDLQLSITVANNTNVNACVLQLQNLRMADAQFHKSKSPRRSKADEFSTPRVRKSRHQNRKEKDLRHEIEGKTPPLPPNSSLDDLLKQRHNLKEELQSISNQPKYDLEISHNLNDSNNKLNKTRNSDFSIKRSYIEDRDTCNPKKNRKSKEDSPEIDEAHLDSEDEETIIEQRRKQRKQLIEKLSSTLMQTSTDTEIANKNDEKSNLISMTPEECSLVIPKENPSTPNITESKEITDMFSDKDFIPAETVNAVTQNTSNAHLSGSWDWDDADGYYKVKTGDKIDNNQYTVKKILGQGVFSNVVLALDNSTKTEVAIKIMRNNDLIYKTGLKELTLLKVINDADPKNVYHCIKYMGYFMHKEHLCVVMEPMYMDMRKIIKKYGKHGLNLKAVMSYSRQLLLALRLLKKIGIVHADVKPDNILVNEKKNVLKLCDFGSASKIGENEPTPYLVSRFYRAPEIILGIPYKQSIDIWSAACTIYEMATGRIMFTGSSNNKMLKCFMDLKGKIPSRIIRKGKFKNQHFNYNNNFLLHKKDETSGREKFIEFFNIYATRDLWPELIKSHKTLTPQIETKLEQLHDLLENMLILDINKRLSVTDCLKHQFITEKLPVV